MGSDEPVFRYPGERAALVLSILGAVIVVVILGVVSLGLFIGLFIVSLVQLKLSHVRFQKNMLRVSERNFPTVFRLGKLAAYRLKLPVPEIYVTQDPTYNAFTVGFYRYGLIVLHSELVQDFTPAELLFVIGHEAGHIKYFHTTWLTLLNPARSAGRRFLLAPLMRTIFNVWSIKAEYTGDQGGLIACGSAEHACRAFVKLSGGVGAEKQVDLRAISADAKDGSILGVLVEYLGDHPFLQNRVTHAIHYVASPEFERACWWSRS
jgi:Zn-dependent protease with chaperone function